MSTIVQKKNEPVEQLNSQVTDLQGQIEASASEKTQYEERINRLQSINDSMQQIFDANLEKAKIEQEAQIKQLKLEIASLNTQMAKQGASLNQTSTVAENVETMKEQIKLSE